MIANPRFEDRLHGRRPVTTRLLFISWSCTFPLGGRLVRETGREERDSHIEVGVDTPVFDIVSHADEKDFRLLSGPPQHLNQQSKSIG